MTNLRNGASPAVLSREKILVGAPLLIGLVLAMGVFFGSFGVHKFVLGYSLMHKATPSIVRVVPGASTLTERS